MLLLFYVVAVIVVVVEAEVEAEAVAVVVDGAPLCVLFFCFSLFCHAYWPSCELFRKRGWLFT